MNFSPEAVAGMSEEHRAAFLAQLEHMQIRDRCGRRAPRGLAVVGALPAAMRRPPLRRCLLLRHRSVLPPRSNNKQQTHNQQKTNTQHNHHHHHTKHTIA